MSDDYLWDRSGDPDPEVERLERILGTLAYQPEETSLSQRLRRFPHRPAPTAVLWRLAAAILLLVSAGAWLTGRRPLASWEVARLEGSPKVGSSRIANTARWLIGEWLETDNASWAKVNVGAIGEIEVEPDSRLRLLETNKSQHRLSLQRGVIHVAIWAPPRLFFVETPSAVAIDLGCHYTLQVDEQGAGRLHVSSGWVALEQQSRQSFVPSRAFCATRPGAGPGTPYFEDAAETFSSALETLDFGGAEERAAALADLLAASREEDALTLWHLLWRVQRTEQVRIYDRLAALYPPPAGVTPEGVLRRDVGMLDRWWNQLGLTETPWSELWSGASTAR